MAGFSFGFIEGSFLQLNSQKNLRSVAENLISNKQKRTKRICKNGESKARTANVRTLENSQANISQQVITLSDFYSACENKYHVMKTSSV